MANKSHLPRFISAKDRAKQYPYVLHESEGKLFCSPCNKVMEHRRKSSIDYHLRGRKHMIAAEWWFNMRRQRQTTTTEIETAAAAERAKAKQNRSAPNQDSEPIGPTVEQELETPTTLFRTKILSLMESFMVKATSEIVSAFDEIYMGAESELLLRRKEVELLTQRLKEREQLIAQPCLKLEPREEFLEGVLSDGVPERTETMEFALECVVLKAEEPVNSESVGQPSDYQLQLSHVTGAQPEPMDRADDEELLGSPVWAPLEANCSLPPAGQAHRSDQDTACSIDTAELNSSVVSEESASPRHGAPEPYQTDHPTEQHSHLPDGMTISTSSSEQHTGSLQTLQTQDDVNAVGFPKKHRVRVRLTDFPSWQEFKKRCLNSRSNTSQDAPSSTPQESQGRAGEELLAAPSGMAQGDQNQCPPKNQSCPTDQEKLSSAVASEQSSNMAAEESAGASQDLMESNSSKSSEVVPPVCKRRGRPPRQSAVSLSAPGTSLRLRSRSAAAKTSSGSQEPLEEFDSSPSVDRTNLIEEATSLSSESDTENSSDMDVKSTVVKRKTAKSKTSGKIGDVHGQTESTASKRGLAAECERIPKKRKMTDSECQHDVYGALYPFEEILQKRTTADGKEEVRVKWRPCSKCGAKWRNSWTPA